MATWYHVAGPTWRQGQPLLCASRLAEIGIDVGAEAQWDAPNYQDRDVISLHSTLPEAQDWLEEYARPGSRIVRVDIDDESISRGLLSMTTDSNGCAAVRYTIPAELITEA